MKNNSTFKDDIEKAERVTLLFSWVITVTGTTTFTLNGSKSYGEETIVIGKRYLNSTSGLMTKKNNKIFN